jgi:ADP-heptose:LPS heptosyltransferase
VKIRSGNKAASRWHRWLDRHLGIPTVALLSFFRAKRSLPRDFQRIALIKGDGMGDLVLLTGPLRDLRRAFPSARISFWGGSSAVPLARELASLDEVHLVDFKHPWRATRKLRLWHADVVIDTGQWSRMEALISGMSDARFVIGFQTANQHRHRLYDVAVAHRNDRHELENFRALFEPLGFAPTSMPFIGKIDNADEQIAIATPYVVFHMWPSGVTHAHLKRWPKNYWVRLAEACIERGRRVVLTGAKQDVDLTRRWMAQLEGENWIENRTGVSIRETISILQNAEAVVAVNTGVMHLAAALGVPTIDLHGPTSSKRWGAIGQRAIALQVPPPHGAYLNLGFEYPADADAHDGMETISVQDVLQALSKIVPDFPTTERKRADELVEA